MRALIISLAIAGLALFLSTAPASGQAAQSTQLCWYDSTRGPVAMNISRFALCPIRAEGGWRDGAMVFRNDKAINPKNPRACAPGPFGGATTRDGKEDCRGRALWFSHKKQTNRTTQCVYDGLYGDPFVVTLKGPYAHCPSVVKVG